MSSSRVFVNRLRLSEVRALAREVLIESTEADLQAFARKVVLEGDAESYQVMVDMIEEAGMPEAIVLQGDDFKLKSSVVATLANLNFILTENDFDVWAPFPLLDGFTTRIMVKRRPKYTEVHWTGNVHGIDRFCGSTDTGWSLSDEPQNANIVRSQYSSARPNSHWVVRRRVGTTNTGDNEPISDKEWNEMREFSLASRIMCLLLDEKIRENFKRTIG